ncbi:hypothetical protein PAXINDRAFT_18537 [Paxillus involutus ATCC 200175]|uniref:NACHT domain-containing protein n=1 Tax=Paxillus involutus ATCC 200175 TaxID=664439 RepID=A0A0C9TKH6_PAXIN|nr:hypothetical protein PAXINDRAFT_18537 [Paxillus involutus ATCC 200175]
MEAWRYPVALVGRETWIGKIGFSVCTSFSSQFDATHSARSSSVIEELKSSQRDGEVLAFFYCDFHNEWSTSATEVMRSLLTQLLRLADVDSVNCRDAVPELAKRKAEGTEPPSDIKLLTRLVCQVAHQLHRRPLIIIDALDECKDVEKLLNAVKELNNGHIQLFVTSRPERIIRDTLSDLLSISLQEMRDAVSADMERHITTELDSRRWLRILEPKLKKEIISALLARADGMFRWVQCQIDTLAKCPSAGEIRTTLKSLPSSLDKTYERILYTIDQHESQKTLIQRALVWLVAALQPLDLSFIMEALKIDLERQTLDDDIVPTHKIVLLDACGSLVTHDVETDIVSLSHFSVKEYLTGELIRARLPQYHIGSQECAHEHLARLCMCYMNKHSSTHLVAHTAISSDAEESSADEEESFGTGLQSQPLLLTNTVMSSDVAESSANEEESFGTGLQPESQPLLRYVLSHGFDHLAYLGSEHDLVFYDMKTLESNIRQFPRRWK